MFVSALGSRMCVWLCFTKKSRKNRIYEHVFLCYLSPHICLYTPRIFILWALLLKQTSTTDLYITSLVSFYLTWFFLMHWWFIACLWEPNHLNNPHTQLATTFTFDYRYIFAIPWFFRKILDCKFYWLGLCLDPHFQNMKEKTLKWKSFFCDIF